MVGKMGHPPGTQGNGFAMVRRSIFMPPRSRAGADASAHVGHAERRAERGGGGMKKVVDHTGKTFTYDEDTCEFVVEYRLLDRIGKERIIDLIKSLSSEHEQELSVLE